MEREPAAWRVFVRRHQRRFIAAYLGALALGILALAVPAGRRPVLGLLERVARWWDDRWARRLAHGEELLRAGKVDEAVDYLARLDQVHPATNVRHGRDKEREWLLVLLARGYERQGRNGRSVETLQRLVAFDSLNYRNHLDLARGAERMLSGWALAPEARDAYQRVLTLLPSHLPSVRGYIDYYMDRGEFGPVVRAFQDYLDAFLVQPVTVSLGDRRVVIPVLVDGRAREIELAFPEPATGDTLTIATGGLPVRLERIEAVPVLRVGMVESSASILVNVGSITTAGFQRVDEQRFAGDSLGRLTAVLPPGVYRGARIRIALYKPVDAPLWALVAKSYRNLLDRPGLAASASRVITAPTPADADRALARLYWATEGLGPRAHDLVF